MTTIPLIGVHIPGTDCETDEKSLGCFGVLGGRLITRIVPTAVAVVAGAAMLVGELYALQYGLESALPWVWDKIKNPSSLTPTLEQYGLRWPETLTIGLGGAAGIGWWIGRNEGAVIAGLAAPVMWLGGKGISLVAHMTYFFTQKIVELPLRSLNII